MYFVLVPSVDSIRSKNRQRFLFLLSDPLSICDVTFSIVERSVRRPAGPRPEHAVDGRSFKTKQPTTKRHHLLPTRSLMARQVSFDKKYDRQQSSIRMGKAKQ
jgi:hypothetical protein